MENLEFFVRILEGKIFLLVGATFVIILVALIASGIIPVLAKGLVIVTLTDEETGKSIGRVNGGYVRVMLGGLDQGYLTDKGELRIKGVDLGTHELVLIIPHYGEKRQFVEVGSGQTVPADIVVDMPNPIFEVTVECNTHWWFDEVGDISVTLTNRGGVDSRSTSVLVIVHTENDTSNPIATHMLDFPSLVPRKDGGISHTLTWRCNAFVWGRERVHEVPRIVHAVDFEDLRHVSLYSKLEFLRRNELEETSKFINRELRNAIAHLSFKMDSKGNVSLRRNGKWKNVKIHEEINTFLRKYMMILSESGLDKIHA